MRKTIGPSKGGPYPADELEPADAGHHHVAEDEVEARQVRSERLRRIVHADDLVPITPEHAGEGVENRPLVVHRQNPCHQTLLSLSVP